MGFTMLNDHISPIRTVLKEPIRRKVIFMMTMFFAALSVLIGVEELMQRVALVRYGIAGSIVCFCIIMGMCTIRQIGVILGEREKAVSDLQRAYENMEWVLDAFPVGLVVVGEDHRVLNINKSGIKLLEMATASAEALLGVINDILDFSKFERFKKEIRAFIWKNGVKTAADGGNDENSRG